MTTGALSGLRVLVVEDEVLVAMYVEDLLEDAGCEVVGPAPRLDVALSIIESGGFDVAILDVNLNGEQVWPAAEALQKQGVPHIFLTGYTSDTIPSDHAGTLRLAKPILAEELFHTLITLAEAR